MFCQRIVVTVSKEFIALCRESDSNTPAVKFEFYHCSVTLIRLRNFINLSRGWFIAARQQFISYQCVNKSGLSGAVIAYYANRYNVIGCIGEFIQFSLNFAFV